MKATGSTGAAAARRPSRSLRANGRRPGLLDSVYARAGIEAPSVSVVLPGRIPEPYRSLLVTRTLEAHVGGPVSLRPLAIFREGRFYFRRVLLVDESSGRPVEMGVVRLDLRAFNPSIRERILHNRVPLGRLLRDGGVEYASRPTAFLAVEPNPEMLGVFWMPGPRTLYGRQTEVTLRDRKIGDIVEVLPRA